VVVVVLEELEELDVLVDVDVDVLVDGHTVVTPSTFKPGGTSDEIGVPTGTLNTRPPTTCTRSTQPDAPTAGDHSPNPATVKPADTSPTKSFRLLITVACLLPPNSVLIASSRDHLAAWDGRY
jgi:hypothetical protein